MAETCGHNIPQQPHTSIRHRKGTHTVQKSTETVKKQKQKQLQWLTLIFTVSNGMATNTSIITL